MACKLKGFDKEWNNIQKAIEKLKKILQELPESGFTTEEYMAAYTAVYSICVALQMENDCEQLYDEYRNIYVDHIASTVLPSLKENHGEFFLRELVKAWGTHKVMIKWLSRFFFYLERSHISRIFVPGLHEVGVTCFRDMVCGALNAKALDVVVGMIEKDRDREQVDRTLLKNVFDVFVEVGMKELEYYKQNFEAVVVEDTGRYYSLKASKWILEDSCSVYMAKAEDCLKSERERVAHYLHSSSEQNLVARFQHELLVVYRMLLLEKEDSGFRALIRDDKVEDLSRIFRLYQEIPNGLEPIADMFKQLITDAGTMLVQDAEDASTSIVTRIIEIHKRYMGYVEGCFKNHNLFHKALREAFEVFCNKIVPGGSSIAELLSAFCDNMLKKGGASEKLSIESIEENLENVVKLIAYVNDRDLFAEFYKKKLSNRLLYARSASQENEDYILSKLKQQYGVQFTSKMVAMITDIKLAKESQKDFKKYLQNHPDVNTLGIDLSVSVLTTTSWPSFKSLNINLPDEMLKCIEVFKVFYNTKTRNRRLLWVHSQGTCNVHGKFEAKTIELIVLAYQAAVLLLFNSTDKLSYSEIMNQLNISDEDLVRILESLSCLKYKILKKTPNTVIVSPDDIFEFNSKFTDRMRRIKIPLPHQVAEERKNVVEEVDKDRRYTIDAAIMRIMKSRKLLGYQQLVIECVKLLSPMFKPDVKVIKKRIEDLIARDYLERDKDDKNMFMYIA